MSVAIAALPARARRIRCGMRLRAGCCFWKKSALAFAARLVGVRAHGQDSQQAEGDEQGGCLDDDLHGMKSPESREQPLKRGTRHWRPVLWGGRPAGSARRTSLSMPPTSGPVTSRSRAGRIVGMEV